MDWLVEAFDDHLKGMGIELWPGVSFYLTDPKERAKAAQWAADLVREMRLTI